MQILAVFNAKGGVAKTTTTVNLAACYAALGARVLVVDLDYQGNATTSLGFDALPAQGTYELITGQSPLDEVRHTTVIPRLDVIGATGNLAAVDVELALRNSQHDVLRRLLAPCSNDYDIVLLDCPPAMGVLTLNALVSCSAVLMPSPPEPFAHDGLLRTWSLVTRIRGELNTGMNILGILPTLIHPEAQEAGGRTEEKAQDETANTEVLALMRAEFGTRVAGAGIPRDDRLFSRAATHGVPACIFEPQAPASQAYLSVACQLLDPTSKSSLRLHRFDDAAPTRQALWQRGMEGLAAARNAVSEAGLLDTAINLPPVDPSAELRPPGLPDSEDLPPSLLPIYVGTVGLAALTGVGGFLLGWWLGGPG